MISAVLASVEKLRRITAALAAGDEDARWLAARLRRYLSEAPRGGATLELVLGLSPAPGAPPWFEVERHAQRDELLLEIVAKHFSGLSPPRAAAALATEWGRHGRQARGADWRRGYSTAPDGSLRADLFRLAELGGPPGERRLADILREKAA